MSPGSSRHLDISSSPRTWHARRHHALDQRLPAPELPLQDGHHALLPCTGSPCGITFSLLHNTSERSMPVHDQLVSAVVQGHLFDELEAEVALDVSCSYFQTLCRSRDESCLLLIHHSMFPEQQLHLPLPRQNLKLASCSL